MEAGKEAQTTSSQKCVAKGWALSGKILAKLGDREAAAEFKRANTLAEQLGCPALLYPIAFDLGRWYETADQEQEAAALLGKAKAAIRMHGDSC